ncbi:aldolase [Peribacillus sp. JNUCC 23]
MLKAEKKVAYKAFGLSIISEIPLPELPHIDNKVDFIDIEIKIGNLSNLWFDLSDKQNEFVISENLVMFQFPNIATFSVQEGKTIIVSPMAEEDEDMIRLVILGTCMGVLLMQRKIFPLHGSAVAIDGKAYAFIGDQGAGKSTLATTFLNRGYQLLSDDVIALSFSKDDIPFVAPAYPQQKLWQKSLTEFGMETSQYRSIYGRETKFCVPVQSQYFADPLPLAGVFELVKSENTEIEIRRIEKLERFHTLFSHTYRNFLIPRLGLMDWHFTTSASILNKVDVYQLHRPVSGFSAPQLASLILNTVNKGE